MHTSKFNHVSTVWSPDNGFYTIDDLAFAMSMDNGKSMTATAFDKVNVQVVYPEVGEWEHCLGCATNGPMSCDWNL